MQHKGWKEMRRSRPKKEAGEKGAHGPGENYWVGRENGERD